MKAITLTEPWASLVAIGAKKIETRSWGTDYRGPIAIHAAKGLTGDDVAFAQEDDITELLMNGGVALFPFGGWCGPVKMAFPETRGRVVATARLSACLPMVATPNGIAVEDRRRPDGERVRLVPASELPFGHYDLGRYAWILTDVVRLPQPIPARGALGLWDWSPPIEEAA